MATSNFETSSFEALDEALSRHQQIEKWMNDKFNQRITRSDAAEVVKMIEGFEQCQQFLDTHDFKEHSEEAHKHAYFQLQLSSSFTHLKRGVETLFTRKLETERKH